MGNQQERPEVLAAWIAGLFEADGSFMLGMSSNKKSIYFQYQVAVTFTNTDGELAKYVAEALATLGIGYHVCTRAQLGFGTKPIFQFQIQGMKRCNKFLPLVLPYLRGVKRKRAELMYEFTKYRLGRPRTTPYGEVERRLREAYVALMESSETIRSTPSGDDIVRSALRDAESSRND